MNRRILYVGDLNRNGTARHRLTALARLGFDVTGFDTAPYIEAGPRLARGLRHRLLIGPAVSRLNHELCTAAGALDPALVWCDKPQFLRAATLRRLRGPGRLVIGYTIDNPFHTLPGEPGWWRLRRTLSEYDIHIVPRPSSIDEFRQAGARQVHRMPLAFDPLVHYPEESQLPRIPLRYIGSPYGDRAEQIVDLAREGIPVAVNGNGWRRRLRRAHPLLRLGPPLYNDEYRRGLCQADMALAYITHAHRDVTAHKSFEIAACGTMLLAECSDGHRQAFDEDREAVFFGCPEECADKVRYYRAHPALRAEIAHAGARRAWHGGYSNDERLAAVLNELDPALGREALDQAARLMRHRRSQLGLD